MHASTAGTRHRARVLPGLWIASGLLIRLAAAEPTAAALWLTHPEGAARFAEQSPALRFTAGSSDAAVPTITVAPEQVFQEIDGFGYTLTSGSAGHLIRMSTPARAALLRELFAADSTNIGVSYLRVSIGASDLNARVFTYNDLPPGETDPQLARFSLEPDRADVIPILREILALQPRLQIMGSPWSAPSWMKTNGDSRGGELKPEWYPTYAQYFVKYVQGMRAEGIPIAAVTVQNEPLHPGNNPSMFMAATNQAAFIRDHLGPAFRAAGLATKIICYDHNADRPDYPLTILNDPGARPFVDGSAFHLYGGQIEALDQVHAAFPDKHLYFTEQWIGGPGNLRGDLAWHTRHLIIGATRHWCRTVLEWNLAADRRYQPHTDRGGCTRCLGALTIDGDVVIRNPAYYIIAHASKFVRPGSHRIGSNLPDALPNVAFRTPEGRTALIVLNSERGARTFQIQDAGRQAKVTLPGGAVGTFVW